jgi:hypothetical protein
MPLPLGSSRRNSGRKSRMFIESED